MANNTARIETKIDSDLYNAMEQEFLNFKLATTLGKRASIARVAKDWDICQERLALNWKEFIEASIRKWFETKRRSETPFLKKEIIVR